MPEHYCKTCEYKTIRKSSYDKHVASKRHLDAISKEQNGTTLAQNGTENLPNSKPTNPDAICKYCNTSFTTIKSMKRHIKYTCKKNEDADLKELVRSLNEEIEKKDEQIATLAKNQENLRLILGILMAKMNVQHYTDLI